MPPKRDSATDDNEAGARRDNDIDRYDEEEREEDEEDEEEEDSTGDYETLRRIWDMRDEFRAQLLTRLGEFQDALSTYKTYIAGGPMEGTIKPIQHVHRLWEALNANYRVAIQALEQLVPAYSALLAGGRTREDIPYKDTYGTITVFAEHWENLLDRYKNELMKIYPGLFSG